MGGRENSLVVERMSREEFDDSEGGSDAPSDPLRIQRDVIRVILGGDEKEEGHGGQRNGGAGLSLGAGLGIDDNDDNDDLDHSSYRSMSHVEATALKRKNEQLEQMIAGLRRQVAELSPGAAGGGRGEGEGLEVGKGGVSAGEEGKREIPSPPSLLRATTPGDVLFQTSDSALIVTRPRREWYFQLLLLLTVVAVFLAFGLLMVVDHTWAHNFRAEYYTRLRQFASSTAPASSTPDGLGTKGS